MPRNEEYNKLTTLASDIDASLGKEMYLNYHKVGFMYEVLMKNHDKWDE